MKTVLHQAIGATPVVLSYSRLQHQIICEGLKINPRTTVSGNDPRALRGLKATSIIYGPDWYSGPPRSTVAEIDQALYALRRRAVALKGPLPEFHLTEDDL